MKSLEILTTQNVTIEYPLAGAWERFLAFCIDAIIIIFISIILYITSNIILPDRLNYMSFYVSILPTVVLYSLVAEISGNGQSPGKKVTGLKIVKINGNEIRFSDYVARWVFRPVDIYLTLGAVGTFLVTSTNRSQRLGDIVANTSVINIKPGKNPSLKQIETIRSLEDYTPTYLQVVQMKESQMLLIKSAIDQARRFPNNAHIKVIEELTEIVCTRLNIEVPKEDEVEFLQKLINDYIVLTR